MNDVTLIVYHDILVVPILDLQDIAHQRIGCEGPEEGSLGLSEASAVFLPLAVAIDVEVVK